MAIEAEALRALSEKCPAPVKAVGRSLVVRQSEHRRFESYLGSPEMAEFLEALVNAYRDGSLIHRSALAEDTARAAEGCSPLPDHRVLTLRRMLDRADRMQRCLYRAGCIVEGAIYREEVDAIQAVLAPALPLDKEAADANR